MTEQRIESNLSKIKGSYAPVNGLNLYYEIHGDRSAAHPLILLHGGLGGISMFGGVLPALAQSRQVIGVELQAHSHTADIDRPFSFEAMADDVAALIQYLDLENADIMGCSLGGGAAWQAAIRHPERIHKLVVISAPGKHSGWYPEVLAGMAAMNADAAAAMVGSPMQAAYASIAPRPEDWPVLVGKTGQLLRQEYDWTAAIAKIQLPVMIIMADADAIRPAHILELYELLGGGKRDAGWDGSGMPKSRLAILPGTTHYNSFVSPLLVQVVPPFLDAV